MVQRHVLYLGEINDSQRAAWQKSIEVFDEEARQARQSRLFPEDRSPPPLASAVQVRLNQLQLPRPRTGARVGWAMNSGVNFNSTPSSPRVWV